MDGLGSMEQSARRSLVVTAILIRDVFGYLFGGLVQLIGLVILLDLDEAVVASLEGWPAGTLLTVAVVAAAYPVGRLTYGLGRLFNDALPIPAMSFERIYRERLAHFDELGLLPEDLEVGGAAVTPENAYWVFGRWAAAWVQTRSPDLFYSDLTRLNTLRLLAETTTGLVLVLGTVAVIRAGDAATATLAIAVGVLALAVWGAYRMRVVTAEATVRDVLLLKERAQEGG